MTDTSDYEPFLIEVDPDDTQFSDATIARVNHDLETNLIYITNTHGWRVALPILKERNWHSPIPTPGETLRIYHTAGGDIRGMQVTEQGVIFYRTPQMQEQFDEHIRNVEAAQTERMVSHILSYGANSDTVEP